MALLLIFSATALANFNIAVATPVNWSEVVRFTGTGSQTYNTTSFNIGHVEWRIRWSYIPHTTFPQWTVLGVITYPQGAYIPIDVIAQMGATNTSGTSYIHGMVGTFYMTIAVANTEGYTIIVEQDLDSIPEFPSLIILPLFIMATLLAVAVYRRKHLI